MSTICASNFVIDDDGGTMSTEISIEVIEDEVKVESNHDETF